MALADVVQFLGLSRKTGVLRVETPGGRKRLVIEEGLAVYCATGSAKEYLGQHLLARTDLTETDLETAFRIQKRTGQKLGEVLVGSGFISADELETVLRHKLEDSMYELFTWTSGTFEFEEGPTGAEDIPVRLRMTWQDLVMEGARRADESAVIRAVIPGPHVKLVPQPARFKPGFPKNGGDKRIVELAQQGLSVGEILPRFHASDFDILTRMATLVREGAFTVDASAPAPKPPPPVSHGADIVLREATLAMHADRSCDAWTMLRDAAKLWPADPAIASALAACEAQLRRRFARTFGDRSAPLALKVPLEKLMGMTLDSKQAFLATRINGSWPLASIVQLCPFDELEALCLIERLMSDGLVELRAPARA